MGAAHVIEAYAAGLFVLLVAGAFLVGNTWRPTVGEFNDWLAVKLTNAVGSMWCAYAFIALALLGLPDAVGQGTEVQWTSQTLIQLVMLSVIMVGQRVLDRNHRETQERLDRNHGAISGLRANVEDLHGKVDGLLSEE